jgi:hypothetical protein
MEENKSTDNQQLSESLEDKLNRLKDMLSKGMSMGGLGGTGSVKDKGFVKPSISSPKPNALNQNTPKISTGISVESKKNPIKQAQQIHNKDIKDIKMKEAQAHLSGKSMIKTDENGQWSLVEKSGYKGYTPEDNARRKANNVGEATGIQTMDSIKQYGGSGPSAAEREAREMRRKSKKNPVKVFSEEEIAELNTKLNKYENRTTTMPGVSEMGIEARRGDKRIDGTNAHGYSRVSSPEDHMQAAKQIARANLEETKSIKPKLVKFDNNGQWSI